jgi:diguanylate cyclase (GGDEF)-like protein
MRLGTSPPLTDPADLRFRMATLTTGSWLSFAIGGAAMVYFLQTWDAGNRPVLALLNGFEVAFGIVVLLLPMERVVAGRWRETFFLAWTLSIVVVVLVAGCLDPIVPSPLTLPLLMPLLFAGMSYPRRSALVACTVVLVGDAVGALISRQEFAYSAFFFFSLTWTAAMCLWQASNRERQRDELDHQRDELERVSRVDPLTGALNRRGFEERLACELAEAARSGCPITLVAIDLDDLKLVNDRDGHAAGDALLCETVNLLSAALRPMDAIGRHGGDEFTVLLPGAGRGDSELVVGRLRDALAGSVHASFGQSCFPADGTDASELFRRADESLYAVKASRPGRPSAAVLELSWAAALADAVDRRMGADHAHSRCVADHAVAIAGELGWTDAEQGRLHLAAILHDIGKVGVPDRILRKPGPLTGAEFAEIKRHTVVGAEIISRIVGLDAIVPWVRHSHEHVDGSGYPDGLAGDAIPPAARILLVADAFDAMTSDRSYRRALPSCDALAELERNAGTQFDAAAVAALATVIRGRRPATLRTATQSAIS